MSDMVKQVAQAIRAMQTRAGGFVDLDDVAREAIKAMREPNATMLNEGGAVIYLNVHNMKPSGMACLVFNTMIDAALAETSP